MRIFVCPKCGKSSRQPLATEMWCSCMERHRVKGEGLRSFHVLMNEVTLDEGTRKASPRSVTEFEPIDA